MREPRKKPPKPMERHHRLPRSRGGTNNHPKHNIVLVSRVLHRAWHSLFANMTAPEVASAITDCWISPDYYLVAIPRKKKKPHKKRSRAFCTDCSCEVMKYLPMTTKPT